MNLAQILREEIKAYTEGRHGLIELRSWLADHVQEIADSDDPAVEGLDGMRMSVCTGCAGGTSWVEEAVRKPVSR